MSKWGWAARIGGYAAAPFTAGFSIPAGNLAANEIEKRQAANDGPGGANTKPAKPDHPEDPVTAMLQKSSDNLRGIGGNLVDSGNGSVQQVLKYLQAILGDNPGAVMDATRSDRGRVIDQYDTARKTISQFGPRGGGQTSTLAQSNLDEGTKLADITSDAKNVARGQAATLGTQLTSLGLTAEQLASADLNEVLRAVLTREGFDVTKRGQNMEALGQLGEAIGTIIASRQGGGSGGKSDGGGGSSISLPPNH